MLELQMGQASDEPIWRLASEENLAIVSKDEDFFFRASQDQGTVQLVWLRLGNCRNRQLLAAFEKVLPNLLAELEQGARIMEVC